MKLTLFTLLIVVAACFAEITLPSYYGDNMIIQRKSHVCINGYTQLVNSKITITMVNVFFHNTLSATADNQGKFSACFDSPDASTQAFTMQIVATDDNQSRESISFDNLMFGDVYLCSGQSNMQMTVSNAFNASAEIASANYDTLRIFTVRQNYSSTPQSTLQHYLKVGWNSAQPSTVGGPDWQYASATCYFFGRDIYLSLNKKVPIGLLVSSYGGTVVEAWSSQDAISKCKENPISKDPQNHPKALWNAMIVPLLDIRLKAVAWYQGEQNAFNPSNYACQFPAMIQDWREKFAISDLPFYFVQLAGYQPGGSNYAELRLSQEAALQLPNTGMACAVDLGDPTSPAGAIHPRDKQHVGFRLSYWARSFLYGQKIHYQGPVFSKAIVSQSGSEFRAEIIYQNPEELSIYLNGTSACSDCCGTSGMENAFEVKLSSGKWIPVQKLAPQSGTSLYIYATAPEKVTGIRYAYSGYPQCMVYNEARLPSPPFVVQVE